MPVSSRHIGATPACPHQREFLLENLNSCSIVLAFVWSFLCLAASFPYLSGAHRPDVYSYSHGVPNFTAIVHKRRL